MKAIKNILKNYFRKTYLLSEVTVVALFFYIFIYSMSDFTWAYDTFMINMNSVIAFSCLLLGYRLFVYETKESLFFISVEGRKRYVLNRFLIVFFGNIILYILLMGLMIIYRDPSASMMSQFYSGSVPVLFNIYMASALSVLFSPVILSIHQVIHGIFFVSVGINFTAIQNLFADNKVVNLIFHYAAYIFPPIEHMIFRTMNAEGYGMPHYLWAFVYGSVILALSVRIFLKKNINVRPDGEISTD